MGVICIFICFAVGLSTIITNLLSWLLLFSIICLICAPIILFVEVPFLLRICPTSAKFDAFIRRFSSNYMRAAIYGVMSAIQWISISVHSSALIAAAVTLFLAAVCYLLAGVKGQAFQGSKALGGQGVAQMII
ncbi:uncharacterized protein EI97DRAFT_369776 [Westerdykella ornata]|uniref:Golgi apparatus membrane protein TVP18 n=1 Tax=Westerdykella ornata TaxID=318751 RepID=A0A6A6JUT7_WESOR|nr:uncharacterized protein EI97DRAFT_369776 [Westerdykella ornata]KAF2280147.1 hypothetical protein EI97DRAFT_369776 [Westerdykella ornata]